LTESYCLSVVIETLNVSRDNAAAWRQSQGALDACLEALERQTLPLVQMEVIVVADTDLHASLSEFLAQRAPYVRCLVAPGLHYYAQKNFGARAAASRYVAFLDSDCVPAQTWAESIVATLSTDDRVGAVQGVLKTDCSPYGVALLITAFGNFVAGAPRFCLSLTGNNCSFRRSEFLSAPFMEDPVFHGPEVELAGRVHDRGKNILLHPAAAVTHHVEHGFRPFAAFMIYWGWCFFRLRRQNRHVRYSGLCRTLGPLAILLIVPAKMVRDAALLWHRRRAIDAPLGSKIGALLLILATAGYIGYGALREYFDLPVETPAM
jgi:GT2 family glycosyltransferase